MSFDKTPKKSDRFEVITAVFFMTLFAAVLLIAAVPKDNFTDLVCGYAGGLDAFARMCPETPATPSTVDPGQLVGSLINSACVDADGLKISVVFDVPLAGEADIQIFSTGPDFFPSERGMTDTYQLRRTFSSAVDHFDLIIPVDSMPVGAPIFGNILMNDAEVSSHVAYFINVSDCSTASEPSSTLTPADVPVIQDATCLPSRQLMIAFEFERPVLGQYQIFVADRPYQLASVVSQPAILFFSGELPPEGPVSIRLISATDQMVVFEETYTPPVCDAN